MDKLQEIKARISKLKGYENAKPTDQYWMAKEHIDFLIDRPAGTRSDSAAKWGIEASS
ncbi:hypothetical protein P5664_13215 [Bacillus subtilis]|nr:hypothetical protein P5626_09640 [Bacillus subtilis]WGD82716.1 hypothetical protein P5659_17185 [Bacillus subtilis]WGD85182.1 hypothetical protein P5664_13215 [Bacillus subtilis]WGD95894.1 hypothetical protein P5642_06535 [Bacillus subtilis]WGE04188.1 hypothetical protein P5651_15740 [Bacillus subtilis]